MMNKKRSRAIGRTKCLMFIPLTALLMLLSNIVACTGEKKAEMSEDDRVIFAHIKEMPQFPGGDAELTKFLANNIIYPVKAIQERMAGKVTVSFTVNDDGNINDIEVLRGVDPLLDNEAIRVVSMMPKWKPGKHEGNAVNVKYTVPVTFVLQAGDDKSQKEREVRGVVGKPDEKGVFALVDEMPQFPGGDAELLKFLKSNIKYPSTAQEKKLEGMVKAAFVVNKDGRIGNIVVLNGIDPSLDAEAVRVISLMPKWMPGKLKGEPVSAQYTVPVIFRL